MAKKTSIVTTVVPQSDAQAIVDGAVTAVSETVLAKLTPEQILPALSMDALIAALTNPESRQASATQLDERIAARKAELATLEMARRALDPPEPTRFFVAAKTVKETYQQKKSGGVVEHAEAIQDTLRGKSEGLTNSQIFDKLFMNGHSMDRKNLTSYLWSMSNSGKLIKEGPRGFLRYKLAM